MIMIHSTENQDKKPTRDEMHRCPICKKLFRDDECTTGPDGRLICPNNCQPSFDQPTYESPLQDDTPTKDNREEM